MTIRFILFLVLAIATCGCNSKTARPSAVPDSTAEEGEEKQENSQSSLMRIVEIVRPVYATASNIRVRVEGVEHSNLLNDLITYNKPGGNAFSNCNGRLGVVVYNFAMWIKLNAPDGNWRPLHHEIYCSTVMTNPNPFLPVFEALFSRVNSIGGSSVVGQQISDVHTKIGVNRAAGYVYNIALKDPSGGFLNYYFGANGKRYARFEEAEAHPMAY